MLVFAAPKIPWHEAQLDLNILIPMPQFATRIDESAAEKDDGTGRNNYNQLGLGHDKNMDEFQKITENIQQISCGAYYSLIIDQNGDLYGVGANEFGQLGLGHNRDYINKFQKIMENVQQVSCGDYHNLL